MLKNFVVLILLGLGLFSGIDAGASEHSISAAGGIAKPEGIDTTLYFTAAYRYEWTDWAIEPDFGYWKQDEAAELCLARGCVQLSLEDIHVGGNLLYMGAWRRVGTFIGGGAAAHFRKQETSQDVNPPENRPDVEETRLGLQLVFGIDVPVGANIDVTAGIRDDFIFRDDPEGVQTVFKAYGGLRFHFD